MTFINDFSSKWAAFITCAFKVANSAWYDSSLKNVLALLLFIRMLKLFTVYDNSTTLNYFLLQFDLILPSGILLLVQGGDTFSCSSRHFVPSFLPLENKDFNLLIKIKFMTSFKILLQ